MTYAKTYSWILYSIALACGERPARRKEIEQVADGINHAIPTDREIFASVKWLNERDLIEKVGKGWCLTVKGQELIDNTISKSGGLLTIWERISKKLIKLGADGKTQVDCRTMLPMENENV